MSLEDKVRQHNESYVVDLVATDSVEIRINGISVFLETIPANKTGVVQFSLSEDLIPTP